MRSVRNPEMHCFSNCHFLFPCTDFDFCKKQYHCVGCVNAYLHSSISRGSKVLLTMKMFVIFSKALSKFQFVVQVMVVY